MDTRIVVAHLFRLEHDLTLHRPQSQQKHPRLTRASAVLVIPRDGQLRAPHLAIFTSAGRFCGVPPGHLVIADPHVVAGADNFQDRSWRELADVLIYSGKGPSRPAVDRIERLLRRYPGSQIIVDRSRDGWLLGLRDGRTVHVAGKRGFASTGMGSWPGACGSILHCWLSAGLPLLTLENAIVIMGRYVEVPTDEIGHLHVAGRAQLRVSNTDSIVVFKKIA